MSKFSPTGSSRFSPYNSGRRIGLPQTLHTLLEDAEERGETDIVSWVHNGTGYKVHKKDEFVQKVMPRYFETSTYKSYQRSVNLWNFETVRKGPNKGFTSHPLFRRGNRDLCKGMERIRVKGNGKKRTPTSLSSMFHPPLKQHFVDQIFPSAAELSRMPKSLFVASQHGQGQNRLAMERLLAGVSEVIQPSTMNMESVMTGASEATRGQNLGMDRLLAEVYDVINTPTFQQANKSLALSSLMGAMERHPSLPASAKSLANTRIAEFMKQQQLQAAVSRAVAPTDNALAAAARLLEESHQQKQQLIDTAAAALLARESQAQGYLGGNIGGLVSSHGNGINLASLLNQR